MLSAILEKTCKKYPSGRIATNGVLLEDSGMITLSLASRSTAKQRRAGSIMHELFLICICFRVIFQLIPCLPTSENWAKLNLAKNRCYYITHAKK
jgi:hypothetical protein